LMGIFLLEVCFGVGIDVYDFQSKKKMRIKPKGGYREIVICVNKKDKLFFTMQQINDSFLFRKFDFVGRVLDKEKVSGMELSNGYCDKSYYAVSSNLNDIIYFMDLNGSLFCFDINYRENVKIVDSSTVKGLSEKKGASYITNIAYMFFINKDEVFIALNAWEDDEIKFLKLNVQTRRITLLRRLKCLSEEYCYLKEKNYLLYMEDSIRGCVYILNLNTNKIIGKILPNNNGRISCFNIDESGEKIVYCEECEIKIFNLKNGKSRSIKSFDVEDLCYGIWFVNAGEYDLLYHVGRTSGFPSKLTLLNSKTGKTKKINIRPNGDVYVVDNGKKIIVEVGF